MTAGSRPFSTAAGSVRVQVYWSSYARAVTRTARSEERPRHVGLQRLASRAVAANLSRSRPLRRERPAVEAGGGTQRLGRGRQRRQAAARLRVHVVRLRERQWQELRPAGRHVLVEGGQAPRGAGVARHQVDDVDEIGLAEQIDGAPVGRRAEVVLAVDLAARLDDDRIPVAEPGQAFAVAHDVDDARVEADRHGFHLVQRPLEGRVVLARRDQDGELQQRTTDRSLPAGGEPRSGAACRVRRQSSPYPGGNCGPRWSQGFGLRLLS